MIGMIAGLILGIVLTFIFMKGTHERQVYFVPQAPPETLNSAIESANKWRCDHLVIFDGINFRIVKSSYQYAVKGFVVYVAHPEAIV